VNVSRCGAVGGAREEDRETVRAVVVEEWKILRAGIRAIVETSGIRVGGEATTTTEALAKLRTAGADLLVLGRCTDLRALDAVRQIRRAHPVVRIVVLVDRPGRDGLIGLLDHADAIVSRAAADGDLVEALERVGRDQRFVEPALLTSVFREGETRARAAQGPLTHKELSVLGAVARGGSNRQVASSLAIGEATVKTHLANTYTKLGVGNRVAAVGRALELGLLNVN
jgi:DNA-binding NarL/FixJ family response regulator